MNCSLSNGVAGGAAGSHATSTAPFYNEARTSQALRSLSIVHLQVFKVAREYTHVWDVVRAGFIPFDQVLPCLDLRVIYYDMIHMGRALSFNFDPVVAIEPLQSLQYRLTIFFFLIYLKKIICWRIDFLTLIGSYVADPAAAAQSSRLLYGSFLVLNIPSIAKDWNAASKSHTCRRPSSAHDASSHYRPLSHVQP